MKEVEEAPSGPERVRGADTGDWTLSHLDGNSRARCRHLSYSSDGSRSRCPIGVPDGPIIPPSDSLSANHMLEVELSMTQALVPTRDPLQEDTVARDGNVRIHFLRNPIAVADPSNGRLLLHFSVEMLRGLDQCDPVFPRRVVHPLLGPRKH